MIAAANVPKLLQPALKALERICSRAPRPSASRPA